MRGAIIALGMLAAGSIILILTILSVGSANIANAFVSFSLPVAIGFIFLALLAHFLAAYRWHNILRVFGERIPVTDLFQYTIIGYGVGYVAPLGRTGSVPTRMLLIKHKGVSYFRGITSLLIDSVLENTFDVLFGITMLGIFLFMYPNAWNILFAFIATGLIAFIGFFYYRMFRKQTFFSPLIRMFPFRNVGPFRWDKNSSRKIDTAVSRFLLTKPQETFRIFIISILTWTILITQYKIGLNAIGQETTFFQLIIIMVALSIAAITPVPAGVGVLELSQAGIFLALGLDPSVGIAFALLIRLRDFFITILGASFLFTIGAKVLTTHVSK